MTSKNMMDHRNLNCGYQIIFKPFKYSGARGQQQCKAYSCTSPVQHGLGYASYPMIPLEAGASCQSNSQAISGQHTRDQRQ
jgi:hypothetical protein